MARAMILCLTLATILVSARVQTVRVEGGLISGATTNVPGIRTYRAIPYAAPPVGSLRWQAPRPVVAGKECGNRHRTF
jgi:para-nitrobenzyl esterase